MGFEHTTTGQVVLFAAGLVAGLLSRRLPRHGLVAVTAVAMPFLGYGLTEWFC